MIAGVPGLICTQCTAEVVALPKEETTPGHAAVLEGRHVTNEAAREEEVFLLIPPKEPEAHGPRCAIRDRKAIQGAYILRA